MLRRSFRGRQGRLACIELQHYARHSLQHAGNLPLPFAADSGGVHHDLSMPRIFRDFDRLPDVGADLVQRRQDVESDLRPGGSFVARRRGKWPGRKRTSSGGIFARGRRFRHFHGSFALEVEGVRTR